ncbi:hypothetical protein JNB91_00700 [Rhizobium wenxiniae]|nr:hypothetical protein [Rhizobium wenxiniae]MBW9086347.1 hypothetical protein [Rhizobium wenxiniae]
MPDYDAGQEEVAETFGAELFQHHFNAVSLAKPVSAFAGLAPISAPRW